MKMKIEPADVGRRIQNLRENCGLQREVFGKPLGMGKRAIGRWERGEYIPARRRLTELSQVYGVSVDWLLYGIAAGENDLERRLSALEPRPAAAKSLAFDLEAPQKQVTPQNSAVDHLVAIFQSLSGGNQRRFLGYLDAQAIAELCSRQTASA